MSLLRQSAFAAAAALVLTSSRFVFMAIAARRLSLSAFGQFSYGQWLVDICFLVCSLGATGAMARYLAEFSHDSQLLAAFARRAKPLALLLPLLAGVSAFIGVRIANLPLSTFATVMLVVWTIAAGLLAMQTAALSGLRRFDKILLSNVVSGATMLAGIVVAPLSDGDVGVAFAMLAISSFCGLLIGLRTSLQPSANSASPAVSVPWQQVLRYSGNIWFAGLVASLVWSRGELPLVRGELGDAALAHYAAALAIFSGAVQGVMLGTAGVAPHIAHLWGQKRFDDAVTAARTVMDLQLVVSAYAAVVLVFFGERLLAIAFSATYADAAQVLSLLCLGLLSFVVSSQSQLLQLKTDARFSRNISVLGLVVLYALALTLIPLFGLQGAAIARSVTMTTIGITTLLYVRNLWGRRAFSALNVVAAVATLLAAVALKTYLRPDSLLLQASLAAGAIVVLSLALRDREGRTVVRTAARRLLLRWA